MDPTLAYEPGIWEITKGSVRKVKWPQSWKENAIKSQAKTMDQNTDV